MRTGIPKPNEIDRLPPHSIEAEQAALGSVMLDPATTLDVWLERYGESKDFFYDLRHQVIFDAMTALHRERKLVDLVTLSHRLTEANQQEPVGGITYLAALPDASSGAANLEYYLEILDEKRTLRKIISVCTGAVARIYAGDGTDSVNDFLSEVERDILAIRRETSREIRPMKELIQDAIGIIESRHQAQGSILGLSTGLCDLDKITDGLHPGELIVLAGFTSGGKTSLAMNIVEHVSVESKVPTLVFSLEMTDESLALRMLTSRARVNLRNVRDGFLTERDFPKLTGAAGKLSPAPIFISDDSDQTIFQMRAKARRLVQQYGVKLIVFDYIQLATAPTPRRDQNREQEVSAIAWQAKLMAKEFRVPVIALSQLTDEGKLRDSRAVGFHADSVWILQVPEEKDRNAESVDCMPMDLVIKKQRHGPSPATIHLTFFKGFTRFESAAKIIHEPHLPYRD